MTDLKAVINKQNYDREFIYDDTVVLTTAFESFIADIAVKPAENRINSRINMQLSEFLRYNERELFPSAVEVYKESVANNYPIRPYESLLNYTITFNQKGFISTYRDRYDYTGGAHGNTIRKSDTFSLMSGQNLPLAAFFPKNTDYIALILKEILKMADENHEYYFENYKELILQYFNPQNYYLTENGLAIYYQQYEIAPYSTGIVVFEIPYSSLDGMFIL